MNYKLEVIDTPEYLRIVLSGVVDESNARKMMDDFVAALAESKHHRALVDSRPLQLQTSVLADYDSAAHTAKQLLGRKHAIANLTSPEKLDAERFFETVCVNRGMFLRIFTDEQDAIRFLVGKAT